MASRTIDTKIQMEGEREFKEKISEMNAGLKVLSSEMKKTTAEFQDNANSVEALTKKGDVLERTLYSQREKVEELKKAVKQAAETYGEADKETMKWQTQLNNAEAAVYNTEAAIRENNEAMEEAQKDTKDVTSAVELLEKTFGIQLPDGVKKSIDSLSAFSTRAATGMAIAAAAIAACVKVVKELEEATKEAASRADELSTLAKTSGIAADTLQELSYASDLIDVSVGTITGSITKLTNNMQSAANGNAALTEAFSSLGVSLTDVHGNLRKAEEVFYDTIDALGKIENQTERDALSMQIFGKSAQELNPLIMEGSDTLQQYAKEAREVGYVMSEDMLSALNSYQDALDRANLQQEALQQMMAAKMAPGLQQLTEGWAKLKSEGIQLIIDSGIIDALSKICTAIGYVIEFVGRMIEVLNALLHPIRTLQELLGYQNTTLEENAALTEAASAMSENHASALTMEARQMSLVAQEADKTTTSMKNLAAATYTAQQAIAAGVVDESAFAYGGFASESGKYWFDSQGRKHTWGDGVTTDPWIGSGEWDYSDYTEAQLLLMEKLKRSTLPSVSSWYNAPGNVNFAGGATWVGENGPELAVLPRGTQIMSAQESREYSGGDTFYVTIDAHNVQEFNDVIDFVKDLRMTVRKK